ncbi:unnamed protein product [Didymodactylos carnosus]|uniref:Uncharacterized protein n=1 Tax=Didymodactylos carnosus TaxID=1234261 RepID=A0A816BU70_9BILA|nr:unnamed protein product [Didymodactylos carnosus]CAF4495526.1 unnamed protein product [Didymodactylos carnosus]
MSISNPDTIKTYKGKQQFLQNIRDSYRRFYSAPGIVRFYSDILFYILFLGLFSFVLLVDYFPLNIYGGKRNGYANIHIPITEIVLHILLWTLIVEEIREFIIHWAEKRASSNRSIVRTYFTDDGWNILDCTAILLYLIGFIARFIVIEQAFIVSKYV